MDDGCDLAEFVQGLGDTLRAVLALRLDPEADPAELGEGSRERLREAGSRFTAEELLRMLVATADFEAAGRFRRSAQPRIQVEVLLLRLVSLDSSVDLRELLEAMGSNPKPREGTERGGRRGRSTPTDDRVAPIPPPPSAPPPESTPAAPRSGGGAPSEGTVRTAWTEALQAARGTAPGGQLVGLRGATVSRYVDGELHLVVPSGLAADLDAFLGDVGRSATLRTELGSRLGVTADAIRFHVGETGLRRRITAESARDQRLQKMVEADPRLKEAVETLDLKLTEE